MYNSFREEESREERRRRRRGGDDETSASVDEDVRSPDITFLCILRLILYQLFKNMLI